MHIPVVCSAIGACGSICHHWQCMHSPQFCVFIVEPPLIARVERTFAWLLNDRRHSRDYERLTVNSAAMIQVSMIRLLLKRLA
jgi:hypothetical protein